MANTSLILVPLLYHTYVNSTCVVLLSFRVVACPGNHLRYFLIKKINRLRGLGDSLELALDAVREFFNPVLHDVVPGIDGADFDSGEGAEHVHQGGESVHWDTSFSFVPIL